MPIVETSVAVATPPTTAARMTNGRAMAGSAMRNAHPIWLGVARRDVREVFVPVSPPNHEAECDCEHDAGSKPPVKSAAIETPVTEPMVMRTRLGGMVSV